MLVPLSLFVTLAGFVVGLGAVTVIDLHGFLGRRSTYWTETTIRAHKVTKPLIWIGIALVFVGHVLMLQAEVVETARALMHFAIIVLMIVNGSYLSFVISPVLLCREREGQGDELLPESMQKKITLSFLVSFVSWWGLLALLTWYLASFI